MKANVIILIFYWTCFCVFNAKADKSNFFLKDKSLEIREAIVEKKTPTIKLQNCPGNQTEPISSGCYTAVTWTPPTTPNPNSTVESTHDPGDLFEIGETIVTYTEKDAGGNVVDECSFIVHVKPTSAYALSNCPSNFEIDVNGNCDRSVLWGLPIVPCDLQLESTHNSGDAFPLGTTTVTYTSGKDGKIYASCSFTITLYDTIPPVFDTCPTSLFLDANNNCEAEAEWVEPTVSDNCDLVINIGSNFTNGSNFPLGTTTVNYTATDDSGNAAQCSFDVTVSDNTDPEFLNIPTEVRVTTNENCEAVATWDEILAEDNCSSSVVITSNFNSGDVFNLGETNIQYSATDEAGNENTANFNVIVEDNYGPTISNCPENITVFISNDCEAVVNWDAPVFSDNCDNSLQVTSKHNSGDIFPLGTTLVTYTATDNSGNEIECSFNVTVEDDQAPEFKTCVTDIILTADSQCQAIAEWTSPVVTDNCDTEITLESDYFSGEVFPVGTTTVTYTATDNAGNSSICSFEILVEDESSPILLSSPDKITLNANAQCIGIANWEEPIFEDCSNLNISSNYQIGDELPIGITIIEYIATDENGATANCTFEVEVIDQTEPEGLNCMQNISVNASDDCEAVVEWEPPTATDNCNSVSVSSNYESGSTFPVGVTLVEYEFVDDAGNRSFCSFEVHVLDDAGIMVNNCPEDITLKAENTEGTASISWDPPTATAGCSEITITSSHEPGSIFEKDINTVTYTFTKANGQTEYCSFDIIIEPIPLKIEINKLITPNGDGNNDYWLIEGIEKFSENQIIIVDRWGTEIYSAKGYNNNNVVWKGENKSGELVPRGTYYYYILVRNEQDAIERKGFIEILW
ncbi:HYR domain-containing protein [Marivirga salinae]|uniref:HYR domain-containing protein n=1 Tax=Marivirga salinarum TaxID=3059078 RepID=A0AA51N9K8_9BACT|nr:HYR domain-containing protein [Marivirga sp. BDSF4-3]WMN11098.1 HYR domain-containing protein [Marivirga sp. BDSF4-3]